MIVIGDERSVAWWDGWAALLPPKCSSLDWKLQNTIRDNAMMSMIQDVVESSCKPTIRSDAIVILLPCTMLNGCHVFLPPDMSIQFPVALRLSLMSSSLWSTGVKIHHFRRIRPHTLGRMPCCAFLTSCSLDKQVNGHEMRVSYTKPNPPFQDSCVNLSHVTNSDIDTWISSCLYKKR